ncbi:BspA family leucine-rich repeat surface protein [Muricauda oceani]|uniref:BspA family leucine-rich repeat surface protein n=1 Tax=Flagellimonas oceani TaxID=2698672 RepID=A0A6G7J1D4_9FLAO|nr:BspA family leucine-rich repeat surface protein [Allomuricauda oceani]MBW8241328.1 BspA family leucine-rich repeat surface protein [Allomuricauda oceani]QII44673.1 BspA family leucine-rich repeat surface protein [Allomuricauda oceani]
MMKKILFSVLAVALLWSCGKDDGPDTPPKDGNSVPVIAAQDFSAAETISDTEVIGTVKASDEDGDTLTFTIEANSDDLFEITASGELSLASGKTLDAAAKEQHNITVKVDDGEDTASATITIKVTTVAPTNEAPEMADQEFVAAEDIADTDVIGQVVATDVNEDDLTFAMVTNDNDLFMLSESGILTLAEGKTLDYETATSHSITVSVTDGEKTAEATVTITVENVIESMAEDPDSFITTWEVSDIDNNHLLLPTNDLYSYDFTVDWGDGTVEDYTDNDNPEHFYENAGVYTVAIKGEFPSIKVTIANRDKLLSVDRWGNIAWQTFRSAFENTPKLEFNTSDTPHLSNVVDMSLMFKGSNFNGDISDWEVGNVTNMNYMFLEASNFDQDLGGWNIENVENMSNMFDNSGMSKESLNATLIGWSNYVDENNAPKNVTIGIHGMAICGEALMEAMINLAEVHVWNFTGNFEVFETCD